SADQNSDHRIRNVRAISERYSNRDGLPATPDHRRCAIRPNQFDPLEFGAAVTVAESRGDFRRLISAGFAQRLSNMTSIRREDFRGMPPGNQFVAAQPPNLIRAAFEQGLVMREQDKCSARPPLLDQARYGLRPLDRIQSGKRLVGEDFGIDAPRQPRRPAFFDHADDAAVRGGEAERREVNHSKAILARPAGRAPSAHARRLWYLRTPPFWSAAREVAGRPNSLSPPRYCAGSPGISFGSERCRGTGREIPVRSARRVRPAERV